MRINTTTTIIRESELEDGTVIGEQEIEIEASYYAGCPGNYEHPGDPPDVDITSATIDGEDTELTEEEEERAKDKILSDPPDDPRNYDY